MTLYDILFFTKTLYYFPPKRKIICRSCLIYFRFWVTIYHYENGEIMAVLLVEDNNYKNFLPITYSRFMWEISAGMYTGLERWKKQSQEVKVYSNRFKETLCKNLLDDYQDILYNEVDEIDMAINPMYIPAENMQYTMNRIGITKDGEFVYLRKENICKDEIDLIVKGDIKSLMAKYKVEEIDKGICIKNLSDLINKNGRAITNDATRISADNNFINQGNDVFIHRTAQIQQYVSFQADEDKPIVIDEHTIVRAFSIIDGPAYVGKSSVIDSAKIRSGTTIKSVCKIGGEVENSIIENYSNKHHEGFLGHSYLGSWVNIGAIATTSDLKNNYGKIKIRVDNKIIDTGLIKFGSVICDYSKIGIGMMLNTGTVISLGCNIFQENSQLPKFVKPFSWGIKKAYRIEKFIEDLSRVMDRRGVELTTGKIAFLKALYKKIRKTGGKNVSRN